MVRLSEMTRCDFCGRPALVRNMMPFSEGEGSGLCYDLCERCMHLKQMQLRVKLQFRKHSDESQQVCQEVLEHTNCDVLCERFVETFIKEFGTDDEGFSKKGWRILRDYANASLEVRTALEDMFTNLCGWSFNTLLTKARLKDDTTGVNDGSKACLELLPEDLV